MFQMSVVRPGAGPVPLRIVTLSCISLGISVDLSEAMTGHVTNSFDEFSAFIYVAMISYQ